jgi:hypothetical protein
MITSNPFVGSVEFMREAYRRIGLTGCPLASKLWIGNTNHAHLIKHMMSPKVGKHLFIKPSKIKLFKVLLDVV